MAITLDDVKAAQTTWGNGIVAIGTAFTNGGDYVDLARKHIRALYDYAADELAQSDVCFKPTKCAHRQFRPTFEGALSYFVSGSDKFPEDKGFAIAPYIKVEFIDAKTILMGSYAVSMGNYYFTSPDGTVTKVEYTFGYKETESGLKINLHHSSLPFSG